MPTAYCSDFLTFRGKGKTEGVQVDDFDIREDLEKIQPAPIDLKGTISSEDITGVPELPRGVCNGELISGSSPTQATTSAPAAVSGYIQSRVMVKCTNTTTGFNRCYYLRCQGEDQEGCAGEQGGELQIQDQQGGQVRTQYKVFGHLQETGKLQEDANLVRHVQLSFGLWRCNAAHQGKKQNVKMQIFRLNLI